MTVPRPIPTPEEGESLSDFARRFLESEMMLLGEFNEQILLWGKHDAFAWARAVGRPELIELWERSR